MRVLLLLQSAIAACLLLPGPPAMAREQVGQVTLVKTSLTGDGRPLRTKAPVHRDERIRTSASGLGEFLFRDGTKFAVGWNSSVVIDKFVFDDSKSAKDLTVKVVKGSFRWISGKSKSTAYKIVTPSGTLGIRGTVVDFYVGPDGTTAVVLISGAARFCGRNGCRNLQKRCDVVVANPRRGITDPVKVDRTVLDRLGTKRALPFLSGDQKLSGGFGRGGGCNISVRTFQKVQQQPQTKAAPAQRQSAPAPPPEPPRLNHRGLRHPNLPHRRVRVPTARVTATNRTARATAASRTARVPKTAKAMAAPSPARVEVTATDAGFRGRLEARAGRRSK